MHVSEAFAGLRALLGAWWGVRTRTRQPIGNELFRRVLFTSPQMQLVLMTIPPETNIGGEVHPLSTQFIRVESGSGEVELHTSRDGTKPAETFVYPLREGSSIVIPAGVWHEVRNPRVNRNKHSRSPQAPLQIYSIYTPPTHPWNRTDASEPRGEETHSLEADAEAGGAGEGVDLSTTALDVAEAHLRSSSHLHPQGETSRGQAHPEHKALRLLTKLPAGQQRLLRLALDPGAGSVGRGYAVMGLIALLPRSELNLKEALLLSVFARRTRGWEKES